MATQQDVMKAFMAALDTTSLKGTAAVDEAIKACSNFSGAQAVINKMISDQKKAGNADTFLKKYCGINLANKDTGAITGKDAGGSTVKTTESIVPENGSLSTSFKKNSFKVNGLTFKLEKNFDSLSEKEKFIWQGLYTWLAKGALDLIKNSYGYSFNDSDVYFKEVTVKFVDDSTTTWLAWNSWNDFNVDGKIDKVTLNINMNNYKNIDTTNPNGYSSSALFYLDKTLAHEFTHTITYAKVLNSTALPSTIKEGLGELTIGIDDERKTTINFLAQNSSWLKDELNGTSSYFSYAAGYMFLRYLAKQASVSKSILGTVADEFFYNSVSGATIKALGGNDWVYNTGTKTKIYMGAGVDSIFNHAATVTIDGGNNADYIYNASVAANTSIIAGAGKDSIFNHGKKVTISGGNDADYISNFKGNVTIYGGAGNDSLYGNEGSNIRIDAGLGKDYVSNWSSGASIYGGAGNDSIYNYASAAVTIQGGEGADHIVNWGAAASMVGGSGNDTIYGDAGKDTLSGGTGNDKLYGYAGNDKLYGGTGKDAIYGGNGNDSLWGGEGDDTLWGGDGKDVFIYKPDEGTDRIMDYTSGDMLTILKSNRSAGGSFTRSRFSDGTLTLNISGGGRVIFENVNAGDTVNINNKTYTISGNKLK